MNVFLSHAVTPQDAAVPARLRAVAALYGTSLVLPERVGTSRTIAADARRKISQADVVMVLVTNDVFDTSAINREMEIAHTLGKPIIALVENSAIIQNLPLSQHVVFDRSNPHAHEHALMQALHKLQQPQGDTDWAPLGWLAKIGLGLVGLRNADCLTVHCNSC